MSCRLKLANGKIKYFGLKFSLKFNARRGIIRLKEAVPVRPQSRKG